MNLYVVLIVNSYKGFFFLFFIVIVVIDIAVEIKSTWRCRQHCVVDCYKHLLRNSVQCCGWYNSGGVVMMYQIHVITLFTIEKESERHD